MDLPENWEKKALIILVVITFMVVAYAFNPFQKSSSYEVQNQTPAPAGTPVPITQPNFNKSANNSSDFPANITFKLTADQAKNIATQARPGYTTGQPLQGSVVLNGTNIAVWIVPLSKNNVVSKTIYIDANTGIIVQEL
jgi:hypothetical protein